MATGPRIVNFSIPAGDYLLINIDADPDLTDVLPTLQGCDIFWKAWATRFGQKYGDPVISKRLDDGDLQIDVPTELKFHVILHKADTINLPPGNYRHEALIIDATAAKEHITPTIGTMCVTETAIGDVS